MPEPCSITVSVLGRVRCWTGNREIDLGPGRQRAVFAVLAANAGRTVARDELIAGIWGSSAPPTAAGSVYTYVSGLRRCLPAGDLLTSGPAGYGLRLSATGLDAERFCALRAEAAELIAAGDRRSAVRRLDEALGLWHGDAYAGLTGPFIELDRHRLAELRLLAVELRARAVLDLGGDDGLVAELCGLVRDHPLHEPLQALLMRALYAAGRPAEALEVFRGARRALVDELGVEPGPELCELQRQVLAGSVPAPSARTAPTVVPTPVARALRDGPGGRACFGREAELAHLRGLVDDLARGAGAAVWVEGEPGIGKTELLTRALAGAARRGCRVAWGAADELDRRVPLQVLARALGRDQEDDADRVLASVRSACTSGPLILVVDDMQWADPTTVLVLQRLVAATDRLPLLLVAAARTGPHPGELDRLRTAVQAGPGRSLSLHPLAPADIEAIVAGVVGGPLGDNLRALAARAAGNPLYAQEMAGALVRLDAVRAVGGVSDVDASVDVQPPETVFAAVRATVDALTGGTRELLRQAAVLGTEFAVADVVAVTGRSAFDLMAGLEEALAAGVLVDSGTDLAFRHPFLREVLLDGAPAGLHRRAAEVLAAAGAPVVVVAEQLAAAPPVMDPWVLDWLARHHAEVARRMPQVAGELIRRALDTALPTAAQQEALLIELVRLEFRLGRYPIAEARQAISSATDPGDRADMRQLLATMRFRRGDPAGAVRLLREAVDDPRVPPLWRTRHRVLLADFRRGDLTDLDRAERDAAAMLAEATAAGRRYEAAFALQTIWLTSSIRRDHERALAHVDRALRVMGDDRGTAGMYAGLLDNRMFSLQNLDRLADAEAVLREAPMPVAAAVQFYWLGRWDEAMAQATPDVSFDGPREPGAARMLLHGVAALIALRRGAGGPASAHLDAADALPASDAERESCDFLLVARALAAERRGRPLEALRVVEPLLVPAYAPMMLRHQGLPDVLRLALAVGRTDVARRAGRICADEAAREKRPARAYAAAQRCRALLTGDPGPALAAAAHYRAVGRVPELAAALEDAAVLLAAGGSTGADAPLAEAVRIFDTLGATGDAGRARRRVAATAGS